MGGRRGSADSAQERRDPQPELGIDLHIGVREAGHIVVELRRPEDGKSLEVHMSPEEAADVILALQRAVDEADEIEPTPQSAPASPTS